MFSEKSSTEVVMMDKEVMVMGLSLQKSGLPLSFASMGTLWERYGMEYRGKLANMELPMTEYGVCLNKIPDYITGCGVSVLEEPAEGFMTYIIPAGKYIKDTFNAESFEKLVGEVLEKRKVKAWAKANKVAINPEFIVEVYPQSEFDKGNYEMYTLTPVKE